MANLEDLKAILEQEGLMNKKIDFESRYTTAVTNEEVRELLEIETPEITDLTDLLKIENNGRLYAIREDLTKGVDNHKKTVVAGLILRGVLRGKIPKKRIDTLIDGGNFNSAKALQYYTEKFGMKGVYVMSRLFRQKPEIIDMLESPHFKVITSKKVEDQSIEREFYTYLLRLMQDKKFRKNKYCLWHANEGGKAMYPLGMEIAKRLEQTPDYSVSCVGAGSTLVGLQIPVQDYFKTTSIIIGEHELSPLFAKFIHYRQSSGAQMDVEIDPNFYEKAKGLPHIVIGPHYQEINPLLPKEAIARIGEVVQYSEHDWMVMQQFLKQQGISVGNSSAANLSVATNLANDGNNVLTVIFEPFRSFYKNSKESVPTV